MMARFQLAVAVCLVFSLLFVESGIVNNSPEKPAIEVFNEEPLRGEVTAVEGVPGEKKVVVNWCSVCVALMEWLDSHLINETETGLFYLFDKLCAVFPASLQGDCHNLANQLVPIIIELLLEEYIPVQVCRLLTVCSFTDLENMAILHANGVQGALKGEKVDFQGLADDICAALPYKYNALCREMLKPDTLQKMTPLIQPRK